MFYFIIGYILFIMICCIYNLLYLQFIALIIYYIYNLLHLQFISVTIYCIYILIRFAVYQHDDQDGGCLCF